MADEAAADSVPAAVVGGRGRVGPATEHQPLSAAETEAKAVGGEAAIAHEGPRTEPGRAVIPGGNHRAVQVAVDVAGRQLGDLSDRITVGNRWGRKAGVRC